MSLSNEGRDTLHEIASQSIAFSLTNSPSKHFEDTLNINEFPDPLKSVQATFVTLNINDNLRGCIGTLEPTQALVADVAANARAAAFYDPRFSHVTENELALLDIHISVLGEPEKLLFTSEQDLITQLRPGIDGLILNEGTRRGTFLPSVWESLPDANDFLAQLKIKAGLNKNYWSDSIEVSRYTTESF